MPYLSGSGFGVCGSHDVEAAVDNFINFSLKICWIWTHILNEPAHKSSIIPSLPVNKYHHSCWCFSRWERYSWHFTGQKPDNSGPFFVQSSEFFWCLLDLYLLKNPQSLNLLLVQSTPFFITTLNLFFNLFAIQREQVHWLHTYIWSTNLS